MATSIATADNSGVSWGAVFAGAVGAAALSLVLFVLGSGLGLAVVSPWAHDGISGTAVSVSSIVWVTVVSLLASVLGGYLAGRLRTRWVSIHTNEVYFRDTAHGFLAWAVSTLLVATLFSTALTGLVSTGVKVGTDGPAAYYVDSLFRGSDDAKRAPEVGRIFANAIADGQLDDADKKYLGQIVAKDTGLSRAEAEQRVDRAFAGLTENLDDARKASAWLALWLVVSLFVGAFFASWAATFGGRLRDSSVLVTTTA
ncbi:MAG TPA: hypothetical protein VMF52_15745 [Steroidobacteraceae bacterium]|nr:hypothetical protein [Steroidobacteraceae bacterium]